MKPFISCLLVSTAMTAMTAISGAAPTNKPPASVSPNGGITNPVLPGVASTNKPTATISTNVIDTNVVPPSVETSTEELEKLIFKPPITKAPISTMPTMIDIDTPPPLKPEALRHEYIGFRLGMTLDEATAVAQKEGKKLTELDKGKNYQMAGCLTDVPETGKAKTTLMFKQGKLDLIKLYWPDNNTLFVRLETAMQTNYGKPLPVDELFRRYWVLQNNDCIRMLYDIGTHETSLIYGSKDAVFDLSEREKQEVQKDYKGL